jgi:hypothetical protein
VITVSGIHGKGGREHAQAAVAAQHTGAAACPIHRFVYNSPFFDLNLPWYQKLIMQVRALLIGTAEEGD